MSPLQRDAMVSSNVFRPVCGTQANDYHLLEGTSNLKNELYRVVCDLSGKFYLIPKRKYTTVGQMKVCLETCMTFVLFPVNDSQLFECASHVPYHCGLYCECPASPSVNICSMRHPEAGLNAQG